MPKNNAYDGRVCIELERLKKGPEYGGEVEFTSPLPKGAVDESSPKFGDEMTFLK